MFYNRTGRANVSSKWPRAFAVCDRCGFLYNHKDLLWQNEWRGPRLTNIRILVCEFCLDKPQEQLRTLTIPADPIPIDTPRSELYDVEVTSAIFVEGSGSWLLTETDSALLLESQNTPTLTSSGVIYDWGASS